MTIRQHALVFLGLTLMMGLGPMPGWAQSGHYNDPSGIPNDLFIPTNPAVPPEEYDTRLDFNDDSKRSCCERDYPTQKPVGGGVSMPPPPKADPFPVSNAEPRYLNECNQYAEIPELVSNEEEFPDLTTITPTQNRTVYSNTTNVSRKQMAGFFVNVLDNATVHPTDSFHIAAEGGMSLVSMREVSNFSVCMARGGNVAAVVNADNGSIMTYNGNDHIYMAGHNTNMLTRTGAGQDLIEIHQATPLVTDGNAPTFRGENWAAFNIYRTALSGGAGEDTVIIKDTPAGTKWCHLGGYWIFGEYFYVVEFALPPSVTDGPRRQRINIGRSVEYVVFQGRRYATREFLQHGQPADAVARSIPLGDPLQ